LSTDYADFRRLKKNVEGFVGERAFVLVTSAMHMKRAMRCFELQGLKPVPYPVDFLSGERIFLTSHPG